MSTQDERIRIIVDLVGEKAWQDLERDAKRFAETSKKVATQSKAMTRETQALTRSSGALGNRLQNSAFQLGDFLVQVEAGVPATRAFGQQASQLLGAFGPWGAVIGVAAATVPILVTALRSGEEAAKDLETALGEAGEVTGRVTRTFSSLDFTSWNQQFNSATESTRRLYSALLNIDALEIERELREVRKAIITEIGDISALSTTQNVRGGFLRAAFPAAQSAITDRFRSSNLSETFGIDDATARTVQSLTNSLDEGLLNIEEYTEAMIVLGGNTETASEEFTSLIRKLAEAREAQQALLQIERQRQSVQGSLQTGAALPTGGSSSAPSGGGDPAEPGFGPSAGNAGIDMRDGLTDYQKHLAEVSRQQKMALADLANSMQMLRPLGEQVFNSFTSSFDSMVRGIAQGTQSIKDAFKNMAKALIADLIRLAAYRGILALLGGPGTSIGGAFAQQTGQLQPAAFAKGGVVNGPTVFPMARGMGLMGEAGPEAVMPLTRMSNGNLGVESSPMNVTINNMAGAEVTTRQDDTGLIVDIVRATVAGDIARGGTQIASAVSNAFGVQRAGV